MPYLVEIYFVLGALLLVACKAGTRLRPGLVADLIIFFAWPLVLLLAWRRK